MLPLIFRPHIFLFLTFSFYSPCRISPNRTFLFSSLLFMIASDSRWHMSCSLIFFVLHCRCWLDVILAATCLLSTYFFVVPVASLLTTYYFALHFHFWFVLILIIVHPVTVYFFVLHFNSGLIVILTGAYILTAYLFVLYFWFRFVIIVAFTSILTSYIFDLYFCLSLLHTSF